MRVPFTYTTKIYRISLNILVAFIVLILVEKLSKDYNFIKFSIFKKTWKSCGNSCYIRFLRMPIIMEPSCTKKHKVVSGIDQQRNYNFDKSKRSFFSRILIQLNLLDCTIGLESAKNNSSNMCCLKAETVRDTCLHYIKIQ